MIKKIASRLLNYDFEKVEIIKSDRVFAKRKDGKETAGGATVPQIARALTLLAKNKENNDFEISQLPCFESCGVLLDMSRNGVMRVEAVCEYISYMALHGLNMLMLYTEDVFELEGYPHFGYLRGRYTLGELKQIDDFAFGLGVEIIPCLQTLAHQGQYLRWYEAAPIRDTGSVLLAGEEKTYDFIEAIIKTMKKAFRSKRIHIGMDEAHDIGLGQYLVKNGFRNRFDILTEHLGRVTGICEKYGFEPMMWSDMFFRIGSPDGGYYNWNNPIPQATVEKIPEVGMVYWDYYHNSEEIYVKMIERHKTMRRPIIFAGGIWTWQNLLPDMTKTFDTTIPALDVCRREGIKDVFATCWGDDGCQTNYFFSLYGLSLFSEYCYSAGTSDEIKEMAEFITGFSEKAAGAFSSLHRDQCSLLIWSDVLFNTTGKDWSKSDCRGFLTESLAVLENESGIRSDYYAYAALVLRIALKKAYIFANLQSKYKNKEPLDEFYKTVLPELYDDYKNLQEAHLSQWKNTYKMNGWEALASRYGTAMNRIKYAENAVRAYSDGITDRIEELDYEPVYGSVPSSKYAHMALTGEMF